MKKRTKIIIATITSIVALVSLGGCAMTQKESNKQDKKVASSKKDIADDKEAIKQKQLAYLKEHEQEINVFGRINNIEESGWGVDIPINDDESVNLEEMIMGDYISIGGEPIT